MNGLSTAENGIDSRTIPTAYLTAHRVQLPADVRQEPLTITGVGPDYISLSGTKGGRYRLDVSEDDEVGLRYYSEAKDYWQPVKWMDPADVTLLDSDGEPIELGDLPDAEPSDESDDLVDAALSDAGFDSGEVDAPGDWEAVGPNNESGLGALFDSESDTETDYAARVPPMALVQLIRGEPATIDWDGEELTLYPPVDETGGDE